MLYAMYMMCALPLNSVAGFGCLGDEFTHRHIEVYVMQHLQCTGNVNL